MIGADESLLTAGLSELGIPCSDRQCAALLAYQALVQKWNRHFNLVAMADMDRFVVRHLLDSLVLHSELGGARRVLDVGTGAGLPGIPLAIINPLVRFTLLDANGKKTRFLFQAILELALDNVAVENCRVQHYQSPEQIDIVTCRAFSSLADLVEMTRHCLHSSTRVLALKGAYPKAEIDQLPADFRVVHSRRVKIPGNDSERHLITVRMASGESAQ